MLYPLKLLYSLNFFFIQLCEPTTFHPYLSTWLFHYNSNKWDWSCSPETPWWSWSSRPQDFAVSLYRGGPSPVILSFRLWEPLLLVALIKWLFFIDKRFYSGFVLKIHLGAVLLCQISEVDNLTCRVFTFLCGHTVELHHLLCHCFLFFSFFF